MSRALDSETSALLLYDDSLTSYNDIVAALCTDTEDLLEIEFLEKSHPLPPGCDVLIDGNSIAVPKVKLVKAFVVARKILFELVRECPEDKESDLRNATAVVLLMDPEHLTAANTRKKLVQKNSRTHLEAALKKELRFLDSYLTSRLHRHTKSPTLWGHRRWLLEQWKLIQMEHDTHRDLESVVLVAAERHPKNYYAWSHMRWLVQNFTFKTCSEDFSKMSSATGWIHPFSRSP